MYPPLGAQAHVMIEFALLFFLRANAVAVFARLCAQGRACFFGGGESEAKNGALYAARKFLNLVKICFLK